MTDIFSLSIPHLREWSKRQPVDHRLQNEPVDVLNRMATGIARPRMKAGRPGGGGVSGVGQFKLKQNAGTFADHLVCRTWDGETEGSVDVLIAKPWLLRRTPFDGQRYGGIDYVYGTPVQRAATRSGETEHQVIIPRFLVGDILKADKGIVGGTGVVIADVKLEWEARTAGRAWAAVSLK